MHAKRVFERRSERQRRGPSVNEMNAERRTPRRNDDPQWGLTQIKRLPKALF